MIENPLVSVLMTAYNREKYIAEAIESVLASTYTNFELIIVDDCSIDNTVNIARSYAIRDSRVLVFENKQNLGDYSNRNKAATYAKGKYLKYLDSDDTIRKWGLETMVNCMEAFPDAALGIMTHKGEISMSLPLVLQPEEAYTVFFFKGKLIGMGPSGTIIKKNKFDQLGGFSGQQYVGDTELWFRLSAKNAIVCMPPDLIWWREHDEQQINAERKNTGIQSLRFQLRNNALISADCPLAKPDAVKALRNSKNIFSRNIILKIFSLQIRQAIQLFKTSGLKWSDLLKCLSRNKYPSQF